MSIENKNCSCASDSNFVNSVENMMSENNRRCQNMNSCCNMNLNNNMNSCNNMNACELKNATRAELLKQIKCYRFAVIELALYLDTHIDDTKAICLHNKYSKELKELSDKYQKVYGPLTIEYPCNKWRWIEEPWPWEGGMS